MGSFGARATAPYGVPQCTSHNNKGTPLSGEIHANICELLSFNWETPAFPSIYCKEFKTSTFLSILK